MARRLTSTEDELSSLTTHRPTSCLLVVVAPHDSSIGQTTQSSSVRRWSIRNICAGGPCARVADSCLPSTSFRQNAHKLSFEFSISITIIIISLSPFVLQISSGQRKLRTQPSVALLRIALSTIGPLFKERFTSGDEAQRNCRVEHEGPVRTALRFGSIFQGPEYKQDLGGARRWLLQVNKEYEWVASFENLEQSFQKAQGVSSFNLSPPTLWQDDT